MTYYTAFATSESLQALNENFISELGDSPSRSMAPDIVRLLEQFTEECMDAYFLRPIGMIDLNPMGKKVVQGGVSAIKKTIKFALKKVLGKMPNDELTPLSGYIESLLLKPAEGSDLPTYIGVELPEELYLRILGSIAEGREGSAKSVARDFSEGMCELVDVSIDCYFDRPMELLSLSFLAEKIARVSNDTVRAGAKSVIKKVTKTMNDEELLAFFEFAESIIIDGSAS